MADALQTVQKVLQDLIAPDVRETKVRLQEFEKRVDLEFGSVRQKMATEFKSVRQEMATEFKSVRQQIGSLRSENTAFRREMEAYHREMEASLRALMASIAELKVHNEVTALRKISNLRERVAVLEAARLPS